MRAEARREALVDRRASGPPWRAARAASAREGGVMRLAETIRCFVRGFVGLGPLPGEAAAVRRALEERSARRPRCC